jgi:hypothetical protein
LQTKQLQANCSETNSPLISDDYRKLVNGRFFFLLSLQPLLNTTLTQMVVSQNIPFIISKNNLTVQCVDKCLRKDISIEVLLIVSQFPYSADMDKDWVFSVAK